MSSSLKTKEKEKDIIRRLQPSGTKYRVYKILYQMPNPPIARKELKKVVQKRLRITSKQFGSCLYALVQQGLILREGDGYRINPECQVKKIVQLNLVKSLTEKHLIFLLVVKYIQIQTLSQEISAGKVDYPILKELLKKHFGFTMRDCRVIKSSLSQRRLIKGDETGIQVIKSLVRKPVFEELLPEEKIKIITNKEMVAEYLNMIGESKKTTLKALRSLKLKILFVIDLFSKIQERFYNNEFLVLLEKIFPEVQRQTLDYYLKTLCQKGFLARRVIQPKGRCAKIILAGGDKLGNFGFESLLPVKVREDLLSRFCSAYLLVNFSYPHLED